MRTTHIGILGGGQLSMMLVQAGMNLPCRFSVLDPQKEASVAPFVDSFVQGDFTDYETVMSFAQTCDVLTFEIEKVNVQALKDLKAQGKRVIPDPACLEIIQDKSVQRQWLFDHGFPSPAFVSCEAEAYTGEYPVVQKLNRGGYDGQGVSILKDASSPKMPGASLFEALVAIEKELSVLVARKENGEMVVYPATEMVFDPVSNLVNILVSPARISDSIQEKAQSLAQALAPAMGLTGIFAVELFLTKNGELLVNEISPRPHNSGHHTISAFACSQYENHLRVLLDFPLGPVQELSPCVMLNLVAEAGASGPTEYHGLEKVMAVSGAQFVFYGKESMKPHRKMGHVLLLDESVDQALEKAHFIQTHFRIGNA